MPGGPFPAARRVAWLFIGQIQGRTTALDSVRRACYLRFSPNFSICWIQWGVWTRHPGRGSLMIRHGRHRLVYHFPSLFLLLVLRLHFLPAATRAGRLGAMATEYISRSYPTEKKKVYDDYEEEEEKGNMVAGVSVGVRPPPLLLPLIYEWYGSRSLIGRPLAVETRVAAQVGRSGCQLYGDGYLNIHWACSTGIDTRRECGHIRGPSFSLASLSKWDRLGR